jgi:bis(5'-nucleosyl)-tetraphosphatase (symmetrical)
MLADNGERFDAPIPAFRWPSPACCTDRQADDGAGPLAICRAVARNSNCCCSVSASTPIAIALVTGDLVNRGPESLPALRRVRSLAANAIVVLGNHDLHLLALAFVPDRRPRKSDTLDEILAARDRDELLAWLLQQPLVHHDAAHGDLLVHAGLVPQWSAVQAAALARGCRTSCVNDPARLLGACTVTNRHLGRIADRDQRARFVINVLTRLRVTHSTGRGSEERTAAGRAVAMATLVQCWRARHATRA